MATRRGITSMLLVLASLAAVSSMARAVVVLPSSSDAALLASICSGAQPGSKLCWPLSTMHYVQCPKAGNIGKLMACPAGKVYDYGKRTCRSPRLASPCPSFACPTSTPGYNLTLGKPPLSPPYGRFGQLGNYNISFPQAGKYAVFCPTDGHCQAGMTFTVTVYDGPAKGPMYVEVKDFEEAINNTDLYPKRYKDLSLPLGGTLNINWDEPIHAVVVYNITGGVTLPNVPYPPQPTYKCPDWRVINNGTFIEILPGEERLFNFKVPPVASYTWVANVTGTRWFVCPLGTHCRLGMVFKVTIKPPTPGYVPAVHKVVFALTSQNLPDLVVTLGDSIFFDTRGVHALSVLKHMDKYRY